MKERMNGDYELLEEAIELLNTHTVMVGSLVLPKRLDRFNRVLPSRYLDKGERQPLTDALALLLKIRNNERKREQDEHAIAFAKALQEAGEEE